jgi:dTDP-glucose 4,6-dehydratase
LTASISSKVKQLIQISTSEVYGTPSKVPIKEDFPLNAQSPYAASKIAADQLALSFHKSFGLPVSIIRPFNTYGPRQSTRAIIPTIITQALQNKKIEIGSLFPKRDLLFVEDTVNGIISAIGNKKSVGKVINLGSGFEISIKDLASKICKILGIKMNLKHKKVRVRPKKSEVHRLLASTKQAKKILGWSPKTKGIKGLEVGLTKTILWFKQNKNLKNYKSSKYNY